MSLKILLEAKNYIEKKIEQDYMLLETIEALKQDETKLNEEIKALELSEKLIKSEIRKYRKGEC